MVQAMVRAMGGGLVVVAVVVGLAAGAWGQEAGKKRVLFLTKSAGFVHPVIAKSEKEPGEPGFAQRVLVEFGAKHGFEVVCTKDAGMLAPEKLAGYDVVALYTSGNLLEVGGDGQPAMTAEQKAGFLKMVEEGRIGVLGIHAVSDSFRENRPVDPFIRMLGGAFAGHGSQQKAYQRVAFRFPGLEDLRDFEMFEEWYTYTDINPDMTVILWQDTASMSNGGKPEAMYQRPAYPATWARMQGKGRVFYTSMGHREDVWTNASFQQVLLAGLNWTAGRTRVELKGNLGEVTPGYDKTKLE